MEHSFISFNINFNFARGELYYKTANKQKKESKNQKMLIW